MAVSGGQEDPRRDPDWMLLSAGKEAFASSHTPGHEPEKAIEENVRTWWQAATNDRSEWLTVDLGKAMAVHAVQVNFSDDHIDIPCPGPIRPGSQARYIDEDDRQTRGLFDERAVLVRQGL